MTDARSRPWLAVGPRAIDAASALLSSQGPQDRAGSVHEAILVLASEGGRPTLVDSEHLLPRPRAALRALKKAARGHRVVVLLDPDGATEPRVLSAAERIRVATATDPRAALALGRAAPPARTPTSPEEAGEPATPPPLPRAPSTLPTRSAVLAPAAIEEEREAIPRADTARAPRRRRPSEADFTDGCFRRLDRPEDLCRYVLKGFSRATGARRTSLLLVDSSRTALFVKAARGMDPSLLGRVKTPLSSGLAGRAASLGRAVMGHASAGGLRGYAGTAYVVLPLGRGESCQGVVALTEFPGDRLPVREETAALARMAARAGRAIHTARRLEHAEALSATDELTGLANRRAFERAIKREIERARRTGAHVGVGLMDVDFFKSLNDRFGHPAGDRILAQVAHRLAQAFRETDLVCRWGGEEFAVLLLGLADGSAAEALAVLERARHAVGSRPLALGPGLPSPMVAVSGGVAVFPADGADGEELVRKADAALYEAKRTGRDRVVHGAGA